ncbi:DNA-binding domain-containing protein [Paludibacterium sp. B53371]|uniref:HvfC/BufC N-terminal domain-containing protein n=1 Tax=Paludibacterium sp. B53371 TaxID=2806263 RepID=UPI001C041F87|nr:DNA-binding domain-containing protein [Paludibacterium sp. B53371]
MSALHELQQAFATAVFANEADDLLACCAGDPARAGRAIQAYRQSVLSNLAGALQLTYPLVGRIVGEPFMQAVTRRYAQRYPSKSGDLNRYGEAFPAFLAGLEAVAGLPYLPDVARLEWLMLQVSGAADAPPQDLSLLTRTPPEEWGRCVSS